MTKKFNRKQLRILKTYGRQMKKFWADVRADIGDERANAWYMTGDIQYLGAYARPLIDSLTNMADKMREAKA